MIPLARIVLVIVCSLCLCCCMEARLFVVAGHKLGQRRQIGWAHGVDRDGAVDICNTNSRHALLYPTSLLGCMYGGACSGASRFSCVRNMISSCCLAGHENSKPKGAVLPPIFNTFVDTSVVEPCQMQLTFSYGWRIFKQPVSPYPHLSSDLR